MLYKPNSSELKKLGVDLYIDEDELYNNFFIIDNTEENNEIENDIENDIEQEFDEYEYDIPNNDENCIKCFHSNGNFCGCKGIYINNLSPICWCYRDCFSMRTSSDFQDDNDDFDE